MTDEKKKAAEAAPEKGRSRGPPSGKTEGDAGLCQGAGQVQMNNSLPIRELGFLSVCSGIEAVTEAWRDLPFRPLMYSEIEAFPRAVLAQRHAAACARHTRTAGAVPLWGDFTAIRMRHLRRIGIDPAGIDVLIGGTPCQAFSMAGLRRGLSDERGNLSLEFARIADAIDNLRRHSGRGPIVIAWENVEGVLSMPDNAFGCFLAALVGASAPLVPPGRAGWTDAGLVAGPRRTAAWRLLDAQYFGLAQRRRRVLVVASARYDLPGKILFESEGVRRDHPPRREARKRIAGSLSARSSGGGGLGTDFEIAGGLVEPSEAEVAAAFGGNNTSGPRDIASTLSAKGGAGRMDFETETFVAHMLRGEGFDASEDGTGRGTPLGPAALPFDTTQITSTTNRSNPRDGDPCHPLSAGAHPPAVAFRVTGNDGAYDLGERAGALGTMTDASAQVVLPPMGVRRLMPEECEILQGFPRGYTLIPYRGGWAADGPRYKALGNSMPVPMIRWLGHRTAAVLLHATLEAEAAA